MNDTEFEAARYVLFGRILPTLRHALVGELQALRFGVSLARSSSEPAQVQAAITRLGDQIGRGIAHADTITRWFQPDPEATTTADRVVNDCLQLVHGEWQMRGIVALTHVEPGLGCVRGCALAELVVACLVTLGDDLSGPADVTLRVRRRGNALLLTLRGVPANREGDEPRAAWPRRMRWSDVDALASAHRVPLRRRGHRLAARFPLAAAPD